MKVTPVRNSRIDAVRAIACLLVVFVHCVLPGNVGTYVIAYARFAVPFFLLVSGWYSDRDSQGAMLENARRKLRDTGKLAGITAALYAVWNSLNCLLGGRGVLDWLTPYLNLEGLRRLLIFNRAVFLNSIMYYLLMLIYVYVIFVWLAKRNRLSITVWFIPAALIASILLGEVWKCPWYYSGNFLLTGLPFFLLGNRLHNRWKNGAISPRMALLGIAGGAVLTFAEACVFGDVYCYVGTVLLSVSIFALCVSHTGMQAPGWLAEFGRRYSTYVFILHCGIRDTMNVFLGDSVLYQWLRPFLAIGISVGIGMIACGIQREKAK